MANVHPCQVECTLMAFPQTLDGQIWSLLMVLLERVIMPWSKLICSLPDELLYFIVGWHLKVIMALLTLACSASKHCLLSLSLSLAAGHDCITRQWHGEGIPYVALVNGPNALTWASSTTSTEHGVRVSSISAVSQLSPRAALRGSMYW